MRAFLFVFLEIFVGASDTLADPARPQTFYVRYAVNMDFLPPLIGEKRCRLFKPCDIVRLDHFSLTLVAEGWDSREDKGTLVIYCQNRECALERGQRTISYRKKERLTRFEVDDREYSKDSLAVMRYRGNSIGEILLAY